MKNESAGIRHLQPDQLRANLQARIGKRKVTVNVLGHIICIHTQCEATKVFQEIFSPLVSYSPRWEIKKSGWHYIYVPMPLDTD